MSFAPGSFSGPTSMGDGGDRYGGMSPPGNWGGAPPTNTNSRNYIGTIPGMQCDAACTAFGGGFLPGSIVGQGGKAVLGLSLFDRILARLGLGGLVAKRGVTAAETLARGLVSPGGKLGQLLPAVERQFAAAAPRTAIQALDVVGRATSSVGLESGYVISQNGGQIVLQNAGGVLTTLGTEGSILVQRGADVLLHLIP